MEQINNSSQTIRRKLYELDKLRGAFEPFGPDLYALLREVLAIAEKYERRDCMDDARGLLLRVEQAVKEKMEL